jgi:fatty-acyl-CoA synthase
MGPADHVALHARLQPARLAIHDLLSDRRWNYAAFDDAIARCVSVLRHDYRVGRGDRVASLARNNPELLILHLACARIGAIYAPLNWRLKQAEILTLIDDAEPVVLFGDAELNRASIDGVTIHTLIGAIEAAKPASPKPIDADIPSLLLYTSGTSGKPKGALLSERNMLQTAINFGCLGRVVHDSVFLVDAPMFHVIGLVTICRSALMRGAALLISDGFEAARTLNRLTNPKLQISHYFCVPQMAAMLRAEPSFDAAKLRDAVMLFSGGAPFPAANIMAWIDDGIAISDGYGMSEAGTVFGMPVDRQAIADKAGSVGVAMPGVATRIVDADDRDCPPGIAGELLLKGDNILAGYWRRPQETAAFTADGWFRTGDIAVCDTDGFHWLVDRKKDMFISGGENVYPAEIEAALAGFPGIAEAALVGIPDAKWGEVGHLAIVLQTDSTIIHGDIIEYLAARLANYKLPRGTTIMEALPRTASGKVQKALLRTSILQKGPDKA